MRENGDFVKGQLSSATKDLIFTYTTKPLAIFTDINKLVAVVDDRTLLEAIDAKGVAQDYYLLSSGGTDIPGVSISVSLDYVQTSFYWSDVIEDMIALKNASDVSSGSVQVGSGKRNRFISDLASYFRYNAYNKEFRTTNVTGLKDGENIQIQNMLMYAILVVQSLILFISYIKRLFYVILLAMMAPVVVVFDFFQKFGK